MMRLLYKRRGNYYCEECGEVIKWIRLISGMWVPVQEEPVLYIPGAGKNWLVEDMNYDAEILKDCQIYKAFRGMDRSKVRWGYIPHCFVCPGK